MKFVLTGLHQDGNIRKYRFQGIGDDRRTRTEFSVAVDLRLLHKHRVPLQEAPLLFCLFLASRAEEQLSSLLASDRDFVFSESAILLHAEQMATERAATQTDRKPKPFAPSKAPLPPSSPLLIDSQTGSGIGLGSRAGLGLTH